MNALIFILFISTIPFSSNAQETWKDYIIGRPIPGYAKAKQTTAKEWGIQYEAIFAGCVISDKVSSQLKKHQRNNKIYFKTLETKFGADWMQAFNLDVKKKINLQHADNETRILCEVITQPEANDVYVIKKEVAKKWGINYEPRFVKGSISEEYKASLQKDMIASNDYERHLNDVFGKDWKKAFDQEVQLAIAQKKANLQPKSPKTIWVDAVIGKPNVAFFDAKKEVAKEWGINYNVKFMGCNHKQKFAQQIEKINQQNEIYFKQLVKDYGNNWKILFDRAVQKKLNQEQAIPED